MGISKKSKAIVLRTVKYRDSDLVVTFLTSEGEKLPLLARGALRSKKRFSGGLLEATRYLNIHYRLQKTSSGLGTLEEAELINSFDQLRSDYDRLTLAFFVVESAAAISQEGDMVSKNLFDLVGNSLQVLCSLQDHRCFKLHFCLKILFQQGVLEVEDWMKPFLQTPISENAKIDPTQLSALGLKSDWALQQLDNYIKTATRVL